MDERLAGRDEVRIRHSVSIGGRAYQDILPAEGLQGTGAEEATQAVRSKGLARRRGEHCHYTQPLRHTRRRRATACPEESLPPCAGRVHLRDWTQDDRGDRIL